MVLIKVKRLPVSPTANKNSTYSGPIGQVFKMTPIWTTGRGEETVDTTARTTIKAEPNLWWWIPAKLICALGVMASFWAMSTCVLILINHSSYEAQKTGNTLEPYIAAGWLTGAGASLSIGCFFLYLFFEVLHPKNEAK